MATAHIRPVGYLFTDIDASTAKWERAPIAMRGALARHNALIDASIAQHGGRVHDRAGDGVFAIFEAGDPLACAVEIQLGLQAIDWQDVGGLSVRIGVHCDFAASVGAVDQVIANRAARVMSAGWGGQIVITSAAMAAYGAPEHCECVDLGVHRLKAIDEPLRLFSLAHKNFAVREFPPLRSLSAPYQRAPLQSEPIFGREKEVLAALKLLSHRGALLTLTGPGGAGKTRLALEIAACLPNELPVCFVDLEEEDSVAAMLSAMAAALRLPLVASTTAEEQLIAYLHERPLVLFLDNADRVDAQAFLERAAREGRQLRILVTRREAIQSRGETVMRLEGLAAPASAAELQTSPAAVLFAQAARRYEPAFAISAADFAAFVEVCERVGGSPLALHLIAQWTKFLSLLEISEKLRSGLGFLDQLTSDRAGVRSLAGVFETSWALLSERHRDALARLSVFRGGFDLEGAQNVADIDAPMLDALDLKSLVERRGGGRFALHPLLHEHAFQKLEARGEDVLEQTRKRHADHVLAVANACYLTARGPQPLAGLKRFHDEAANLRVAWAYLTERGEADRLRQAAEGIFYVFVFRSAFRACAALFSGPFETEGLRDYFDSLRANCLMHQGEYQSAETIAREILARGAGDWAARAHAHQALGNIAHARGAAAIARAHYEQSLALRRDGDDAMGSYYAAMSLAWLCVNVRDPAAAQVWVKEAQTFCERMDHALGMQGIHACIGDIALLEGRLDVAELSYRESLRLEEQTPHGLSRASTLIKCAAVSADQGRIELAIAQFDEASALASTFGSKRIRLNALLGKARTLRLAGELAGARRLIGEALADGRALGARTQIAEALLQLALIEDKAGDRERAVFIARQVLEFDDGAVSAAARTAFGDIAAALDASCADDALSEIIKHETYARLRA